MPGSNNKQVRIPRFRVLTGLCVLFFLVSTRPGASQTWVVDKQHFFSDGKPIEMCLLADFRKLISEKLNKDYESRFYPATVTCVLPDSTTITEQVEIRPRGNFRREECYMPSLFVNFKTGNPSSLSKLGRLKLVWPCSDGNYDDNLVLKEYLAYKIFNLITERSFRVRLVRMRFQDTQEKIKSRRVYAFFIEDVDDLAKRNGCVEVEPKQPLTESTDRKHTTLVSLFQYMIGNTDWAVPLYQNIKLVRLKRDSTAAPFIIPYDFDYSGLVNARYAIPSPDLGIQHVTERLYLGFPRTMEEVQEALEVFRTRQPAIDSIIASLDMLSLPHRREMQRYLQGFFELIKNEKDVRDVFILNARKM
jgi:hypothetical protein